MDDRDIPALEAAMADIWDKAVSMGLDPFPTHFELVPPEILYEFGAYLLPGRFSHWTHGKAWVRYGDRTVASALLRGQLCSTGRPWIVDRSRGVTNQTSIPSIKTSISRAAGEAMYVHVGWRDGTMQRDRRSVSLLSLVSGRRMYLWFLILALFANSLVGLTACSTGAATNPELQAQLQARDREIARLYDELNRLKKEQNKPFDMGAARPGSVTAGMGDGRFQVIPAVVRPGDPVAIYTDLPNGIVWLARVGGDKEIKRWEATKAHDFLLYRFPADSPAGEYLVHFDGPGGTLGRAVILVDPNLKP